MKRTSRRFTTVAKTILRDTRGQALIETAIFSTVVAILLTMFANFSYMAYVQSTVVSANRQAAVYAAQGQKSTTAAALPTPSTVCTVSSNEMNGWLLTSSSKWGSYVAQSALNGGSWSSTSSCAGNAYSVAPTFNADPEKAYFTNAAVTTNAALTQPINLTLFGKTIFTMPATMYGRTLYSRQQN
jgi:Flp pilus assembly protein TadG